MFTLYLMFSSSQREPTVRNPPITASSLTWNRERSPSFAVQRYKRIKIQSRNFIISEGKRLEKITFTLFTNFYNELLTPRHIFIFWPDGWNRNTTKCDPDRSLLQRNVNIEITFVNNVTDFAMIYYFKLSILHLIVWELLRSYLERVSCWQCRSCNMICADTSDTKQHTDCVTHRSKILFQVYWGFELAPCWQGRISLINCQYQ